MSTHNLFSRRNKKKFGLKKGALSGAMQTVLNYYLFISHAVQINNEGNTQQPHFSLFLKTTPKKDSQVCQTL